MNEQHFVENGRVDYLRGVYVKPALKDLPDCYTLYPDPYMQMCHDYDQGWNYEKMLVPNLHPSLETVWYFGSYNFGNEFFRPYFKAGYRAFHEGVDLKANPFTIKEKCDKWDEGWNEAKYLVSRTGLIAMAGVEPSSTNMRAYRV